jgi:cobalt-zinc-cadmium efflux system protein
VDVTVAQSSLAGLPGVVDVHDLHVWTLTSGMNMASGHLSVASAVDVAPVLRAARALLADEFEVTHATLQVEPEDPGFECAPCPSSPATAAACAPEPAAPGRAPDSRPGS